MIVLLKIRSYLFVSIDREAFDDALAALLNKPFGRNLCASYAHDGDSLALELQFKDAVTKTNVTIPDSDGIERYFLEDRHSG